MSSVLANAVRMVAAEMGAELDLATLTALDSAPTDPRQSIACEEFAALLHHVSERLSDPYAVARVAAAMTPYRLHFVGPFLLSSGTLQQACERFELVRQRVLGGPAWRLESDGDALCFGHKLNRGRLHSDLVAQFTATLAHHLAVLLVGPRYAGNIQLRLALP